MSNEQHHSYLEDPNYCPYCKHDTFDRVDQDGDGKLLWITWSCSNPDCDKSWSEEYTLTSVILDGDKE